MATSYCHTVLPMLMLIIISMLALNVLSTAQPVENFTEQGLCSFWGSHSPLSCYKQSSAQTWCKPGFSGAVCQYPTIGLTATRGSIYPTYTTKYTIPHDLFYDGQVVDLTITQFSDFSSDAQFILTRSDEPSITYPLGSYLSPLQSSQEFVINRSTLRGSHYEVDDSQLTPLSTLYTLSLQFQGQAEPLVLGQITIATPCEYIKRISRGSEVNCVSRSGHAFCDPTKPPLQSLAQCQCSISGRGDRIDRDVLYPHCVVGLMVSSSLWLDEVSIGEFSHPYSLGDPTAGPDHQPNGIPILVNVDSSSGAYIDLHFTNADMYEISFFYSVNEQLIALSSLGPTRQIPISGQEPITVLHLNFASFSSLTSAKYIRVQIRLLAESESFYSYIPINLIDSDIFFNTIATAEYNQRSVDIIGRDYCQVTETDGNYNWNGWLINPSYMRPFEFVKCRCGADSSNVFFIGSHCQYRVTIPSDFLGASLDLPSTVLKYGFPYIVTVELIDRIGSYQKQINWPNLLIPSLYTGHSTLSHIPNIYEFFKIQNLGVSSDQLPTGDDYMIKFVFLLHKKVSSDPFRLSFNLDSTPYFISSSITADQGGHCAHCSETGTIYITDNENVCYGGQYCACRPGYFSDNCNLSAFLFPTALQSPDDINDYPHQTQADYLLKGFGTSSLVLLPYLSQTEQTTPSGDLQSVELCLLPLDDQVHSSCYLSKTLTSSTQYKTQLTFSAPFDASNHFPRHLALYAKVGENFHYLSAFVYPPLALSANKQSLVSGKLSCYEDWTFYAHYAKNSINKEHSDNCLCTLTSPTTLKPQVVFGKYCHIKLNNVLNPSLVEGDELVLDLSIARGYETNQVSGKWKLEQVYEPSEPTMILQSSQIDIIGNNINRLEMPLSFQWGYRTVLEFHLVFVHSNANDYIQNTGFVITLLKSGTSEYVDYPLSIQNMNLCEYSGTINSEDLSLTPQRGDGRKSLQCNCREKFYGPRCDVQFYIKVDSSDTTNALVTLVSAFDYQFSSQRIAIVAYTNSANTEFGDDVYYFNLKDLTYRVPLLTADSIMPFEYAIKFLESKNDWDNFNINNNKNQAFRKLQCAEDAGALCSELNTVLESCPPDYYGASCGLHIVFPNFKQRVIKANGRNDPQNDGRNFIYSGEKISFTSSNDAYLDDSFQLPYSLSYEDLVATESIIVSYDAQNSDPQPVTFELRFAATSMLPAVVSVPITILPDCEYIHRLSQYQHNYPNTAANGLLHKRGDVMCNPEGTSNIGDGSSLCQQSHWSTDLTSILPTFCDCKQGYTGQYCEIAATVAPLPGDNYSVPDYATVALKINNSVKNGIQSLSFSRTNTILEYSVKNSPSFTLLHQTIPTADLDPGQSNEVSFIIDSNSVVLPLVSTTAPSPPNYCQDSQTLWPNEQQSCTCSPQQFGSQCSYVYSFAHDYTSDRWPASWECLKIGDTPIVYWGAKIIFTSEDYLQLNLNYGNLKFSTGYGVGVEYQPGTVNQPGVPISSTTEGVLIMSDQNPPHIRDPITNRITSRFAPSITASPFFLREMNPDGVTINAQQHMNSAPFVWDACDVLRAVHQISNPALSPWQSIPMTCHLPHTELCFLNSMLSRFDPDFETQAGYLRGEFIDVPETQSTQSGTPAMCKCSEPTIIDGTVTAYIGHHCQTKVEFVSGPYYVGQVVNYKTTTAEPLSWNDAAHFSSVGSYIPATLNSLNFRLMSSPTSGGTPMSLDALSISTELQQFTITSLPNSDEEQFHFSFGYNYEGSALYSISSTINFPMKIFQFDTWRNLYLKEEKRDCQNDTLWNDEMNQCDCSHPATVTQLSTQYIAPIVPLFYGKFCEFIITITTPVGTAWHAPTLYLSSLVEIQVDYSAAVHPNDYLLITLGTINTSYKDGVAPLTSQFEFHHPDWVPPPVGMEVQGVSPLLVAQSFRIDQRDHYGTLVMTIVHRNPNSGILRQETVPVTTYKARREYDSNDLSPFPLIQVVPFTFDKKDALYKSLQIFSDAPQDFISYQEAYIYLDAPAPFTLYVFNPGENEPSELLPIDIVIQTDNNSPNHSIMPDYIALGGRYSIYMKNLPPATELGEYFAIYSSTDQPAIKLFLLPIDLSSDPTSMVSEKYFTQAYQINVDLCNPDVPVEFSNEGCWTASGLNPGQYFLLAQYQEQLHFNLRNVYEIVADLDSPPAGTCSSDYHGFPLGECNPNYSRTDFMGTPACTSPISHTMYSHTFSRIEQCSCKPNYYGPDCSYYVKIANGGAIGASIGSTTHTVPFEVTHNGQSIDKAQYTVYIDQSPYSFIPIGPLQLSDESMPQDQYKFTFTFTVQHEGIQEFYIRLATPSSTFLITSPVQLTTSRTCPQSSFDSIADGYPGLSSLTVLAFGPNCQGLIAFNPTSASNSWQALEQPQALGAPELHIGERIALQLTSLETSTPLQLYAIAYQSWVYQTNTLYDGVLVYPIYEEDQLDAQGAKVPLRWGPGSADGSQVIKTAFHPDVLPSSYTDGRESYYFYAILDDASVDDSAFLLQLVKDSSSRLRTPSLVYHSYHPLSINPSFTLHYDPSTRSLSGLTWLQPLRAPGDDRFDENVGFLRFFLVENYDPDMNLATAPLDISSAILLPIIPATYPDQQIVWIPEDALEVTLFLPRWVELLSGVDYAIVAHSSQSDLYESLPQYLKQPSVMFTHHFQVDSMSVANPFMLEQILAPDYYTGTHCDYLATQGSIDTNCNNYHPVCADDQFVNIDAWSCGSNTPCPLLDCPMNMIPSADCTQCICDTPLCETTTRQFMLYFDPKSTQISEDINTIYQTGFYHQLDLMLESLLRLTTIGYSTDLGYPASASPQNFIHEIKTQAIGNNGKFYSPTNTSNNINGILCTITLQPVLINSDNYTPDHVTIDDFAPEFDRIARILKRTFNAGDRKDFLFFNGWSIISSPKFSLLSTFEPKLMKPTLTQSMPLIATTNTGLLTSKCLQNGIAVNCPTVTSTKSWTSCPSNPTSSDYRTISPICYDLYGRGVVSADSNGKWCKYGLYPGVPKIQRIPCKISSEPSSLSSIVVATAGTRANPSDPELLLKSDSVVNLSWFYSGPENRTIALWLEGVQFNLAPPMIILSSEDDHYDHEIHTSSYSEYNTSLFSALATSTTSSISLVGNKLYLGTFAAVQENVMIRIPHGLRSIDIPPSSTQQPSKFHLQLLQSISSSANSRNFVIKQEELECTSGYWDLNTGRCACKTGDIKNLPFLHAWEAAQCTCSSKCLASPGSDACSLSVSLQPVCLCKQGFFGFDCNLSTTCSRERCNNRGDPQTLSPTECSTCTCDNPSQWDGPTCNTCSLKCNALGGKANTDCTACECGKGFGGPLCQFRQFLGTISYNTPAHSDSTPIQLSDVFKAELAMAVAISLGLDPFSVSIKRVNTTSVQSNAQNQSLFQVLQSTTSKTSITFGVTSTTTSDGTQTGSNSINDLYNQWNNLQTGLNNTPIGTVDSSSFGGSAPVAEAAYDPLCTSTTPDSECPSGTDPLVDPLVPEPQPPTVASTSSIVGVVIGVVVGGLALFCLAAFLLWYMHRNQKGCFADSKSSRGTSTKKSRSGDNSHLDLESGTEMSSAMTDSERSAQISKKTSKKTSTKETKSATADLDPVQDDEELPQNWSKFKHKTTGDILYVNTVDMISQKNSPNDGDGDNTSGTWF